MHIESWNKIGFFSSFNPPTYHEKDPEENHNFLPTYENLKYEKFLFDFQKYENDFKKYDFKTMKVSH